MIISMPNMYTAIRVDGLATWKGCLTQMAGWCWLMAGGHASPPRDSKTNQMVILYYDQEQK